MDQSPTQKESSSVVEGVTNEPNQNESYNDNLLEPLAEVPFYQREKDPNVVFKISMPTAEELKLANVSTSVQATTKQLKIINIESEISKEHSENRLSENPNDNETRVITLDSIIRKGLVEQMPMTAKDTDNKVPNAIQKENIKQKMDTTTHVVLANTDSEDDSPEYENLSDVNAAAAANGGSVISIRRSKDEELSIIPTEKTNKITEKVQPNKLGQSSITITTVIGKPLAGNQINKEIAGEFQNKNKTEVPIPDPTDINSIQSDDINMSSLYYSDSESATESYDETSGTESPSSSKTKKPRHIRLKSQTEETTPDTEINVSDSVKLNKRGRPFKSYDETEIVQLQLKKKRGRKLKIQRYTGPKRKPGRPKRDDGMSCYNNYQPDNSSSTIVTTPMDELMAMGHSLFTEYRPKKPGRRKRDSFEYLADEEPFQAEEQIIQDLSTNDQQELTVDNMNVDDTEPVDMDIEITNPPLENMLLVQHSLPAENNNAATLMFRRKPGRPKIDKESGGHIVFQNSELTVVNKTSKLIKTEVQDERQSSSISIVNQDSFEEQHRKQMQMNRDNFKGIIHSVTKNKSDIEIVPIPNAANRFMLPRDTTIHASSGSTSNRNQYNKNVTVLNFGDNNANNDHSYNDESLLIAPIDEMLEVHHVEEYNPNDIYESKRRGRKPKHDHIYGDRNIYTDYGNISIEPTFSIGGAQTSGIEQKKRGRKPKSVFSMDFSNPSRDESANQNNTSSRSSNGPSISVKNINDLLAVPSTSQEEKAKRIRKPKIMDFPYELPATSSRKSATLNTDAGTAPTSTADQEVGLDSAGAAGTITNKHLERVATKPRRNKRLSSTQPTYVEWSESSSDHNDTNVAAEVSTTNNAVNYIKSAKPHWKSQLRMKRGEKYGNTLPPNPIATTSNIVDESTISQIDIVPTEQILLQRKPPDLNTLDAAPVSNTTGADNSVVNTETTANPVDVSVKSLDDTLARQKRVPKLKYGSFNFNERRDKFSNKPKMVLKYKKKYKRKPKPKLIETDAVVEEDPSLNMEVAPVSETVRS